jgi:hypothetical protein
LTDPVQTNIIASDPPKQTSGGRHQIGTPAGFKSESVAGLNRNSHTVLHRLWILAELAFGQAASVRSRSVSFASPCRSMSVSTPDKSAARLGFGQWRAAFPQCPNCAAGGKGAQPKNQSILSGNSD